MNKNVPPFTVYVDESFFYDLDATKTGWIKCTAFGVTSYVGETLTLSVLTDTGAVFDYVPAHLVMKTPSAPESALPLDALVYNNCGSDPIDVVVHDVLKQAPAMAFLKRAAVWMAAEYLFSVEFYAGNDKLNAVWLENGQFAFLPNHKINFTGAKTLPDYKKLHATWKV